MTTPTDLLPLIFQLNVGFVIVFLLIWWYMWKNIARRGRMPRTTGEVNVAIFYLLFAIVLAFIIFNILGWAIYRT